MESRLPLVAVVADDPGTAMTISLIVSDLCRVRYCRAVEELNRDLEHPSLILTAVEIPGLDRCGFGREPTIVRAPRSPLVYILMAETRISNDGAVLRDCLASVHDPVQFRAVVEARLGVPPPPCDAPIH